MSTQDLPLNIIETKAYHTLLNKPCETITYKQHAVHYIKFGQGAKILIALHGYGDTAKLFTKLNTSLSSTYTVYAIDLPFHGKTQWKGKMFTNVDIINIIYIIAEKHQFTCFSLMGYSMGGRIALGITQALLPKLNALFLLASPGIIPPVSHVLIDNMPKIILNYAERMVEKPRILFFALKLCKVLRFMPAASYAFTLKLLNSPTRRRRMYSIWCSIRHFVQPIDEVIADINKHNLPVYCFWGERDVIIPIKSGEYMSKYVNNCTLFRLPNQNHFLVNEDLNMAITQLLRGN